MRGMKRNNFMVVAVVEIVCVRERGKEMKTEVLKVLEEGEISRHWYMCMILVLIEIDTIEPSAIFLPMGIVGIAKL